MDINCKVIHCRYNNLHTTKGHKCGKCNNYGHGQLECNMLLLRERLRKYWHEEIKENERCNFINCNYRNYHKTLGHECIICYEFGHISDNCEKKTKIIKCPICRTDNNIRIKQKKIKGLNDECCICMENKVEVYLDICGHVCICYECFTKS